VADIQVDAIVIGAGPGGYHAAIRLGQLGKNVVCFDRDEVGGVCLNWGCIPTKALLHVGEVTRHIREADKIGIKVAKAEVDREGVAKFKDKVVKSTSAASNTLFKANNVTFAYGEASFTGKNTVALKKRDGTTDSTRRRDRDRDRQRADRRQGVAARRRDDHQLRRRGAASRRFRRTCSSSAAA
jgi:pyruvate/2-oxoglutarate dehydrogenase complex dihydrolipoamide dehydrogenase (E3) component